MAVVRWSHFWVLIYFIHLSCQIRFYAAILNRPCESALRVREGYTRFSRSFLTLMRMGKMEERNLLLINSILQLFFTAHGATHSLIFLIYCLYLSLNTKHWFQDARDFLNAFNFTGNLVTSFLCRKITVGTVTVVSVSYLQLRHLITCNSFGRWEIKYKKKFLSRAQKKERHGWI